MILDKKEKQPVEIKDYPIDYTEWLSPISDTIADAVAQIECLTDAANTALSLHSLGVSTTGVAVWLSGGTDGERYKVTVTVTTLGGRVDQSEFIIKVKEH